jgi:RNA polymerase sigma-70 factor, ECF subfamily
VREPGEAEIDRWMEQLRDGEREAFAPLYRALHPRAVRFARARVADGAEDVAQEALCRVFSRAAEFMSGRPALPWFYAILANEVRGHVRRQRASGGDGQVLEDAWQGAPDDPERLLLEQELSRALDRAIASLDGASAEVIRAVLGKAPRPAIDAAAFRKRVSRAYARLRVLLGGTNGS